MCGICGILATGEADFLVEKTTLDRMVQSMAARGPDGHGTWWSSDGAVGLGHRRLAIIDLSDHGRQPMSNEDGTVWVTFNGEIYNYRELRRELEASGHVFRSNTDTECIVHLYEELGERVVEKLDGDFAFAVWDARRRCLFLARDPLGVKPLYYGWIGREFVFASELKAIITHPRFRRQIDDVALYHYLTFLAVPAPWTLAEGISKLRAGESLTVYLDGRTTIRRYWEPLPRENDCAPNEWDERLQDLFDRAVSKRMLSDVPVGVLFSGGVDSTLNAMSFAEIAGQNPVRAFTVGMRASRYSDESTFAEQIARVLGLEWYKTELTESALREMMGPQGDLVERQDEPLADPVCAPLHLVTALARENGTVVLQAGEGADETLCGYDGYRRWMSRHSSLWRPLSALPRVLARLGYHALMQSPRHVDRKIADVLLRRSQGKEFFISEAVGYYETEKSPLLSQEYRQRVRGLDSYEVVAPYYARIREACPRATFLQTLTYIELSLRLPELLLMRADKIAMSNSVELRVPFLDRALVEFTLSLPESFKLRDGVSKEPYKRLAARKLERRLRVPLAEELGKTPKDVFYRRKKGFGAPIQDWFEGPLGNDMRDLMKEQQVDLSRYFDLDQIAACLDRRMANENQAFQMWVLYCFMRWKYRYGF